VLIGCIIGDEDLLDASQLRSGGGYAGAALAGHQHMHRAADGGGGGERLVGDAVQRIIGVFGNQKNSHLRSLPLP
jgi:hypothetical protein